MSDVQFLKVDVSYASQRLDNFLASRLRGLPKSRLYRLLRKGEIRVNKKRKQPCYRVQAEDVIRIPPLRSSVIPARSPKPSKRLQALLTAATLFEDDNLLIINKPPGFAVHSGSNIPFGVIEIMQPLQPHNGFLELAHRLDRMTSGCLLMAKKSNILKELHSLLRTGVVEKTYLVLVSGYWPDQLREIAVPLQRHCLLSGERMVRVNAGGKSALTRFQIVSRFTSCTLLQAKPYTGRTHQIRVHTQHAQHPIVGDEKYGAASVNRAMSILGCRRLFLHASELKFYLPSQHQMIYAKAELPNDLDLVLQKLATCSDRLQS